MGAAAAYSFGAGAAPGSAVPLPGPFWTARMQRLFVMFPDRAPGVGLVLLRLGLCAAVLTLPMAPTGWLQLASLAAACRVA